MFRGISAFIFFAAALTSATAAPGDTGFVNLINGATQPIKVLLDGKVAFEGLAPGTMTGGMSLAAGKVKLTAEAEGMKDDSAPVDVVKDSSALVIVAEFEDKEDPTKKVLRVEQITYKVTTGQGFSASLIYAGRESQITLDAGGQPLTLKRYAYVDVGSVSRSFGLKNAAGQTYQSDFYEPIHYTLVVLDSSDAKKLKVLVVPNIKFSKPTF